ncbi:DUF3667 domain-containing protein [Polaribacter sp. BAL334]|uniref:DUF3667 domain-containing protein n=1 Tax=Polaribacter sp. BAL334 TaxID=1708178 RepID=UPI0018D2411D|nr:DUF3667 domain-containing protein [Polaribacter sp. BAL334]MBG7610974.1 DUF3667 domain-containing protein [Polaribacter sp. BAL334]
MNCGHPFSGHENFCPECGQENKGSKITFKSFVHELFNGFFNFDAKFWRTLIPLLIKPGKVSRDYIEGKRQRYTNPFRFYLAVSIIFFLLVGLSITKKKYESFAKESKTTFTKKTVKKSEKATKKNIDSIIKKTNAQLDKPFIPDVVKKTALEEIEKEAKDTTKSNKEDVIIQFGGVTRLDKFGVFNQKNPDMPMDDALDSLKFEKNFTNRFLYTRVKAVNSFNESEENRERFFSQMLSYGSVALFILLPFFTLFLKFFYIRRKYTYVDHLIFVFHTQTVFFMLFTIFILLEIFGLNPTEWIFIILFLLYLILAMKNFYQQGYIKTFAKFILLNLSFLIVASIGVALLFIFSFALA